ncbi:MAG: ABC transporter ATP-binding protein [Cyclobacteriaceae bacterium]|nr:ABC transporter ATP-binding protein [Cyclobacteriaceae bacterium]
MNESIKLKSVYKYFELAEGQKLTVLNDINFTVSAGDSLAIIGPSGSGKTTLLGLCAGLDAPSEGEIFINGRDITRLNEDERAMIRNRELGFVFQNFQLLPTLSALDNVKIPLEIRGNAPNAAKLACELLEKVGLKERMQHFPSQLSGGEQQRVAIARAFIGEPAILFADEPTGNLDEETAGVITDLLFGLHKEMGTTLIMVTHNNELALKTGRRLTLMGGKIVEDIYHQ